MTGVDMTRANIPVYSDNRIRDALDVVDNHSPVEWFKYSLLGKQPDGNGGWEDIKKQVAGYEPVMTKEGVYELVTYMRPYLSQITSFTNITDREVSSYTIAFAHNITDWVVMNNKKFCIKPEAMHMIVDMAVDLVEAQLVRARNGWLGSLTLENHHHSTSTVQHTGGAYGVPESKSSGFLSLFRR